jgi:hypothetical protein
MPFGPCVISILSRRHLSSLHLWQGRRTGDEIEYALLASEHRESIVRELERRNRSDDQPVVYDSVDPVESPPAGQQYRPNTFAGRLGCARRNCPTSVYYKLAAAKTPEGRAGTYFYLFATGSTSFRRPPEMLRLVIETLRSLSYAYGPKSRLLPSAARSFDE